MFRFGFRVVGILTFCTLGGAAEQSPRTICVGGHLLIMMALTNTIIIKILRR